MDCDMEAYDNSMAEGKKEEAMMIDEKKKETQLIIVLRCADNRKFSMVEEMGSQIPFIKLLVNNHFKKLITGTKPKAKLFFNIDAAITYETLKLVLTYLSNRLYPSEHPFDFDAEFLKLEPSVMLNLIQAAHILKIKSLMDLTCKRLADKVKTEIKSLMDLTCKRLADKVKTETSAVHHTEELYSKRKNFHQKDVSNRKTSKKRTDNMSPSVPQDSDKDCSPEVKWIFRDRRLECFINESDFVDVHVSPPVTTELFFVKKWVNRLAYTFDEYFDEVWRLEKLEQLSVNLKQLKSAMCRLKQVVLGDPRFSSCLRKRVVLYLVKFLHRSEYETDIKCAVVSILSRANFEVCGDVIESDVIPVLVKLLSDSTKRLSHEAVSALTHLAYTFPDRIKVIVDDNALQAACMAFRIKDHTSRYCFSKFLAAVCRGYSHFSDGLPSDKVDKVLNFFENQFIILEDQFVANQDIHVFACYSFLYLSYKRSVALEEQTWNSLIGRLIQLIYITSTIHLHEGMICGFARGLIGCDKEMIIGSALGVIGNFVRWGSAEQIESLITEHHLIEFLRRLLLLELKKFHMEGCRIISNIAARRNIVVYIVKSGVVECLCKLLENEDFEVKLEAAWAIFNSILSMV